MADLLLVPEITQPGGGGKMKDPCKVPRTRRDTRTLVPGENLFYPSKCRVFRMQIITAPRVCGLHEQRWAASKMQGQQTLHVESTKIRRYTSVECQQCFYPSKEHHISPTTKKIAQENTITKSDKKSQ